MYLVLIPWYVQIGSSLLPLFLAYGLGGGVGGSPLDGLARGQLNCLCLIDSERVPRSGEAGGGFVTTPRGEGIT